MPFYDNDKSHKPITEMRNTLSVSWSQDGKTIMIGTGIKFRNVGAAHVFEESSCDNKLLSEDLPCAFLQIGDLPCQGEMCGTQVAISSDGLSILYLMANEEGRPALHRYQRVTTVQPSHQKRPGDDDATSTAIKIGSGGDSSLPSIPKLEEIRQGLGASDSISWRLKGLVSVRHLVIVLLLMA